MTKLQKLLEERDRIEKEFQELVKSQEAERDSMKTEIDNLLKDKKLFCGVILTEEDLVSVLRLKFATKKDIEIPFQIYIKEPKDS